MPTTERNHGVRAFLARSAGYDLFQRLVGSRPATHWLVEHFWKPVEGTTVVDIGCGSGTLRKFLPESIKYHGFDPNPDYIETARANNEGSFHLGTMPTFLAECGVDLEGSVDLVLCWGVLHHVDPTASHEILAGARRLLRTGGRFTAVEPAFLARQDRISRWILRQDRGTGILADIEWLRLVQEHFHDVEMQVTNRLLRIPYTHALLAASA